MTEVSEEGVVVSLMSLALNASCVDCAKHAAVVFRWVVTKSKFLVTKLRCGGCSCSIGGRYVLVPGCGSGIGDKSRVWCEEVAEETKFDHQVFHCRIWRSAFILLFVHCGSVLANSITRSIAFAASWRSTPVPLSHHASLAE